MNAPKFRFSIKYLLITVSLVALVLAGLAHRYTGLAKFEILENNLKLNERSLVEGNLIWGYRGVEHHSDVPWRFVCEIRNLNQPELLQLPSGKKTKIRYRYRELGILKKQDPFEIYITGALRIPKECILGYAISEVETRVVIGKQ